MPVWAGFQQQQEVGRASAALAGLSTCGSAIRLPLLHFTLHNPPLSLCRVLACLMGLFVGAVFFDVTFDVSGAQNRVGESVPARKGQLMPPECAATWLLRLPRQSSCSPSISASTPCCICVDPPFHYSAVGAMFFVLCFFAFTSLTTVDLFQMERKMVVREVRGEHRQCKGWQYRMHAHQRH